MDKKKTFFEGEVTVSTLTNAIVSLIKIDPSIGSIHIKGKFSPMREEYISKLLKLIDKKKTKKIYPSQSPSDFNSSINIVRTLAERKPVFEQDFFEDKSNIIILPMAEKIDKNLACFLKGKMENSKDKLFVALDESENDEYVHENISQNITFFISVDEIRLEELKDFKINYRKVGAARKNLEKVVIKKDILSHLINCSDLLGITDSKIAYKALKTAKAICSLKEKLSVSRDDVNQAVSLVMIQKAKRIPEINDMDEQTQSKQSEEKNEESSPDQTNLEKELLNKEMLIESIKANLPKDLIEQIIKNKLQTRQSGDSVGSGEKNKNFKFGRPLPSIGRKYSSDKKIDLISTLTKAIPWQKIRKKAIKTNKKGLIFYPDDITIKQFDQKSERVLIFIVDSSGSNAIGRLAEAKGAVEILLSDAYAKRDNVALISFGGDDAKTLLPPTRSLVAAKKKLGALTGGGGTPLARGLLEANNLALSAKNRNIKPVLILLSDGKSNLGLNGEPNREIAMRDSLKIASTIKENGLTSIFIDTSKREQQVAKDLASNLNGKYFPLPKANSESISNTIKNSI